MVTKKLSEFIVCTNFQHIPPEAVKNAKAAFLDTLGTILAGANEDASNIIAEYARELGGSPEASVIGKGFKTNAPLAAVVNSTTGHSLDYDDTSYSWFGHPTVVLLPAVLSLSEKYGLSGKAIVESYIIGFEVGSRIGQALGTKAYEAGWHYTSIIGVMAAAAACAKVMKLDLQNVRMCLGIAGSLSCGLKQNFGTMTKPFHAGVAAQNGVTAARLAGKGFSANANILDIAKGYGHIFGKGFDPECVLKDLGSSFSISSHGLAFKPYPSCRGTHQCIDAVLHLVNKYNIEPSEVVKIECRTAPIIKQMLMHNNPKTALESKFSLEYCVARALVDHEIRMEHFTPEKIHEKEIQVLISKVKHTLINHENGSNNYHGSFPPVCVNIECRNGDEFGHEVKTCRGDPDNPLTQEELIAKFRDCSKYMLSSEETDHCIDMVLNMESLEDVGSLMDVIGK